MESKLKSYRQQVDKKLAEFNLVRKKLREETKALKDVAIKIEHILQSQELTQQVARQIQQKAHDQIASVVSRCLETVFDEPYEFHINFEMKRGRTEARLTFVRDGAEVDPMTASGGGVIDVAAFALRLSCLMLTRPPLRRTLILDEPFKFLSEDLRDRARVLLENLSRETGVQFIMITHIAELKTGKIVEL